MYVLVRDNGYEGCDPPIQAFAKLADAQAQQALACHASHGGSWKVYAVPLYPEPVRPSSEDAEVK